MSALDTTMVQCPYCWENLEVEVDRSASRQEYVEDCQVCCQPILIRIAVDGKGNVAVTVRKENG